MLSRAGRLRRGDAFEVRREYSRGKETDAASIPVVIVYRW